MDRVLKPKETRAEFLRVAVERELQRRERLANGEGSGMSLYEIESRIAEAKRRRAESQVGRDNAKFVLVVCAMGFVVGIFFYARMWGQLMSTASVLIGFLTWAWIRDSNWREETWKGVEESYQETKRRWEKAP